MTSPPARSCRAYVALFVIGTLVFVASCAEPSVTVPGLSSAGTSGDTVTSTITVPGSTTTDTAAPSGNATTTIIEAEPSEQAFRVGVWTVSPNGNWLLEDIETVWSFDAQALRRELVDLSPEWPSVTVTEGVVAGGPDLPDPFMTPVFVDQSLAAQALFEGTASTVSEGGRSLVTFSLDLAPDPSLVEAGLPYAVSREVTIDSPTAMILQTTITMSDGTTSAEPPGTLEEVELRYEELRPSQSAVAAAITDVRHFDGGFHRVDLVEAQALSGYALVLPTWMPEDFRLSSVAYSEAPLSNIPETQHVTVVTYRREAAQIDITFRRVADDRGFDPWNQYGDFSIAGSYHYAAGDRDFTIAPPLSWLVAHAWSIDNGVMITVSGSLSTGDIEAIVDSLATPDL